MKRITKLLKAFHHEEQGADLIEYILIVAAVSLPILGVVIWYWRDIILWVRDLWDSTKAGNDTDPANIHHTGG